MNYVLQGGTEKGRSPPKKNVHCAREFAVLSGSTKGSSKKKQEKKKKASKKLAGAASSKVAEFAKNFESFGTW